MLEILIGTLLLTILAWYCNKYIKPSKLWGFGLITILGLVIGFRKDVGLDYEMYELLYYNSEIREYSLETFWIIFMDMLSGLYLYVQGFFLIVALMTMYGFYYGIKHYSPYIFFSIFIFIVSGLYFETTNTIRQCIAMAALFAAFPFYIKKNLWVTLPMFILVCMLHNSGIIAILMLLIASIKFNKYVIFTGYLLTFIWGADLMDFIFGYIPVIAEALEMNAYGVNDYSAGISSGIVRFFYGIVGLVLLIQYPKYIKRKPSLYIAYNMIIMGFMIYNIFYIFQPGRRLFAYGFMFLIYLMPYLYYSFNKKMNANIVVSLLVIGFLILVARTSISMDYDYNTTLFRSVYNF